MACIPQLARTYATEAPKAGGATQDTFFGKKNKDVRAACMAGWLSCDDLPRLPI